MREATVDQRRRSLLTGRLDDIRRAEIHVASLVVYVNASRAAAVASEIGRLPGVEVHANNGCGKMVVVVETGSDADMAAAIDRVDRTAGVICTALVYQQAEPLGPDE